MRILFMGLLAVVLLSMTDAAYRYPQDLFISPVNRDIRLSGTFGELRNNHFHAGLDIKSKDGSSGEPVVAVGDGYVSRIKVEEFGYGNVLYVNHPNGYTTVYAHLEKFAPEIQTYVKQRQYKEEAFEVDIPLEPNVFPVRTAQLIGYLGNTGSSGGPHLHYEIRHTRNQTPINPLHFGYQVTDNLPPVLQQLIIYALDEKDQVLDTRVLQPKWQAKGQYGFTETISLSSPKMAFALRTYDGQDGTTNQNGIYSIDFKIDGEPTFAFSLDEIPFDQSRYLNAHIDYSLRARENKYVHRCHMLEGNRLPIYYAGGEQGRVHVNTEKERNVTITAADFKGNQSRLTLSIRREGKEPMSAPVKPHIAIGQPGEPTVVSQPGIQVVWPKGTFYEKTPINISSIPGPKGEVFSPQFELTPDDVPAHYYFDVLIEGLKVPHQLLDKAFIARCDPGGSVANCGGRWIGNNLVAGVRTMGTYAIMVDTIPPRITPLHFNAKMTGWARMAFRVNDNYPARERARDLRYEARVDGKWILLAMDGKTGVLTHEFDGRIAPGTHELVLRATDDRGNTAEWRKTFVL